jgi:hypothetical protein
MTWMPDRVGRLIAGYLQKPASGYDRLRPPIRQRYARA